MGSFGALSGCVSPKKLGLNAGSLGTVFRQFRNVSEDGFLPPRLKSMGLVVCLVLRVVSAQAENGKTKGTETGLGDVWGLDNALLV